MSLLYLSVLHPLLYGEERDTYWKDRELSSTSVIPKREGADYDTSVELAIAESNDLADRGLIASVRIDLVGDDPVRSAGALELRSVEAVVRDGTRSIITPEDVAKRWNVGLSTATKTLQVTTQLGVRTLTYPAQRRFQTAMPHLRYAPTLEGDLLCGHSFLYDEVGPWVQVCASDWEWFRVC
ncbi:hypothetical protein MHU86_17353 [Fragilaria crotonensis]|nr:hypothetical protein MHU86_17353 [Fragilaria crotonensis]